MDKEYMEDNGAVTEPVKKRTTLWQDHTHGDGYNPELTLIEYESGKKCLELNSFGSVIRLRYVDAECPRCS